ncbi:hypothetical protein NEOKW01_0023 [Nematocida sp. AWRm80]|nr:hypothetical protein NEOKW01_0023 [Nematocida sp. AWRm80]
MGKSNIWSTIKGAFKNLTNTFSSEDELDNKNSSSLECDLSISSFEYTEDTNQETESIWISTQPYNKDINSISDLEIFFSEIERKEKRDKKRINIFKDTIQGEVKYWWFNLAEYPTTWSDLKELLYKDLPYIKNIPV